MAPLLAISAHTTASSPRPHILYTIEVNRRDGKITTVHRRYSDVSLFFISLIFSSYHLDWNISSPCWVTFYCQFLALHTSLAVKPYTLPPKRILATTFVPSAWVDDSLIDERKAGLQAYLRDVASDPFYAGHPALEKFITPGPAAIDDNKASTGGSGGAFNPEDAVPSTLTRKAALEILNEDGGVVRADATSLIAASYYPGGHLVSFRSLPFLSRLYSINPLTHLIYFYYRLERGRFPTWELGLQ
jgi:chitinase